MDRGELSLSHDRNSPTICHDVRQIRGGSASIRNLYSYVTSSGDIRLFFFLIVLYYYQNNLVYKKYYMEQSRYNPKNKSDEKYVIKPVISVMIIGVMRLSYNERAVSEGRFRHHLFQAVFVQTSYPSRYVYFRWSRVHKAVETVV